MKNSIIYISLFIALLGLCSCSMKEQFDMVSNESTIQFVPRITGFNGVDVATKADGDAPAFETDVYTAYLLIFDNNGNRVYFASVDENNGSWSQKVTMTNLTSGTACFIANVPQTFAEGIATITDLNSAVLTLTYATYSEAGGYLGVPKLSVNGEYKLCLPMFGSTQISNMTHNQTLSIPVKRLFAKISVELKLDMNLSGLQSTIQTLTNYELSYFNLHNLHNKVRLVANPNSESSWKDGSANPATFQSASIDAKIYNSTSSMEQKSYSFDCYVPEFYLNPKSGWTNDQRYKPLNKPDGTYPIYLELVGQYNAYSITSTDINYKVYLGNDNVSDFSLARNTHYKNVLTIKGTSQNSTTPDNLDHRVTTSTINNPVAKAGKAANCYVINATGEYNFPAYKGAYNDLTKAVLCNNQTANELVILANDNSSNIELTDYIYDPERNLISFNVSKIANGNIVLGLKNRDGSLEWSWHLWFNREYDAGALGQWAQINTQTMPDGTTEMIDRNLGASPSTLENLAAGAVDGNYYKYGHRAPYFTDSVNGAAYHGYEKGDYSSWNTTDKSHTDPCPPGYRVPNSSVWSNTKQDYMDFGSSYFTYKKRSVSIVGGVEFDWEAIVYPYSGYVNTATNPEVVLKEGSTNSSETEDFADLTTTFRYDGNYYRFEKVTYQNKIDIQHGKVWSSNAYQILFGYTEQSTTIDGVHYSTRPSKLSGSWSYQGIMSISDFKDGFPVQHGIVEGYMTIKNGLENYFNKETTYDNTSTNVNINEGYQVRCVKE